MILRQQIVIYTMSVISQRSACLMFNSWYLQPSTRLQNSILQNRQDKTTKASPKEAMYMEHSPCRISSRYKFKSLRSCSGNRVKMLLKSHLGIICHSKYITVIRLLQHSSAAISQFAYLINLMFSLNI